MTDIEQNTELTEQPSDSTPEEVVEVVAEAIESTPDVSEETPASDESVDEPVTQEITEEPASETETQVTENTTEDSAPDTEEPVAQAATEEETLEDGEEPRTRPGMNWFVLRVASNKEDYVRGALEKKVQIEAVEHLVGRIMVPTEKTKTLTKTGKAKITETKLYPGYIFVEMQLVDQRISQDVFFLIKETTGVGDFVGTAGKPTPMSNEEVDKMLYDSQAPEEVTEVKLEFAKGDRVSVKDGPFLGHEGTVDEIYPEKGVVRVLATVFGRQTPLDIEYWMIEKTE